MQIFLHKLLDFCLDHMTIFRLPTIEPLYNIL